MSRAMSALRYRQQIENIGKENPLLLPCELQQLSLSSNSSAPASPPPVPAPAPALLTRHGPKNLCLNLKETDDTMQLQPVAWAPSPAPLRSPRPGPNNVSSQDMKFYIYLLLVTFPCLYHQGRVCHSLYLSLHPLRDSSQACSSGPKGGRGATQGLMARA